MHVLQSGRRLASLTIAVTILLALGGYVFNILHHQAADTVFWGSLESTLNLSGITCTVDQQNNDQTRHQAISLDIASKKNARSLTTLQRNGTTVTTDTISTPDADYVRYVDISAPGKQSQEAAINKIINVWAKQARSSSVSKTVLEQTALGGCIVPLVQVSPDMQASLMAELRQGKIFQTDLQASSWHWRWNQPYREYTVTIAPEPYIRFMQKVDSKYGTNALKGLDVASFRSKTPQRLTFQIFANSHRLNAIFFSGTGQTMHFSDYDIVPDTRPPAKTVTAAELQKRLEAIR